MKKLLCTIFMLQVFAAASFAQSGNIAGKVVDAATQQPLAQANVVIPETALGTTTDVGGNFLLQNVPAGEIIISVSFMGYAEQSRKIRLTAGQTAKILLQLHPVVLPSEPVIISSLKYEKQPEDVAIPLVVVSSQQIFNTAPLTVADALQAEPGVVISRDAIWATDINIRGLSRQNIVTLVDGNRIETATNLAAGLSMIDLNDVKRIEVLKGGVSTLYGSGAFGGIVNIITKSGHFAERFDWHGTIGSSFSSVNESRDINLTLQASHLVWFGKMTGTVRKADDTETPKGILPNSQFQDYSLAANVGLKPFARHIFELNYQKFRAQDVGIPGGAPFPANATATYPEQSREMFSAEYRITNLSDNLTLLATKIFRQVIKRRVEIVPNPLVVTRPGADHKTDGFQVQSNWILRQSHLLVAGIDVWQRQLTSWRAIENKSTNQIIGQTPLPESSFLSAGLFAQGDFSLLKDKLRLTLGGRYDRIRIQNQAAKNPAYLIRNGVRIDNPPNQEILWQAGKSQNSSWSSSIGILNKIRPDIDLAFNLARSFRSPSLEERFQFIQLGAATYKGNPDLKPEHAIFLDTGLRVRRQKLNFNIDLFLNRLDNLVIDRQVLPGTGSPGGQEELFQKDNVGRARIYGFDCLLASTLRRYWGFYASATFTRGEDLLQNENLPEIPPLHGSLGVRFLISKFSSIELRTTIFADQNQTAPGEAATPGYTIFDIYLNINRARFGAVTSRFIVGIENLADRAYRNHLSTYRGLLRLEAGRNIKMKLELQLD